MTYKAAYKKATGWKRKARIVYQYHIVRLAKKKFWRVRDTANYFGLSMGATSENLNIALNLGLISIKNCKSRNEALKKLKRLI